MNVVHRTCTICEASCGLSYEVEADRVLRVRPDADDVLSRGYACPKGIANAELHADPDRLREPMRRTPAGDFEPISWDEAIALAVDGLKHVRQHAGKNGVATYFGLPSLVSSKPRCTLRVHPADAEAAGLHDGDHAWMQSRVHVGKVPIEISDEMRQGVVSLPHGWGHAQVARYQRTAGEHAGVSINDWTDDKRVESVVGQSILNGVPVSLHRADPRGSVRGGPCATEPLTKGERP